MELTAGGRNKLDYEHFFIVSQNTNNSVVSCFVFFIFLRPFIIFVDMFIVYYLSRDTLVIRITLESVNRYSVYFVAHNKLLDKAMKPVTLSVSVNE